MNDYIMQGVVGLADYSIQNTIKIRDYSIQNIMKVQNSNEFIEYIQSIEEFNDFDEDTQNCEDNETYKYSSYISMTELGCIKGQELADYFRLSHMGSGCFRCALDIGMNRCVKIALNSSGISSNRREWQLYSYVKRECPQLLSMLLPIIGRAKNFNIYPLAIPTDVSKYPIRVYHTKQVIKMFKHYGILIGDIEGRPDNFGIYNGKIVVIDYGDWISTNAQMLWRENHKTQYFSIGKVRH